MVDPLTVVSIASEGLSICIKVIGILKRYASAVKNVKKDLVALLKRVERMRNIFGLLRSLLLELCKTPQKTMQLEIDQTECEQTMQELLILTEEVQKGKQILVGLHWGNKKSSAVRLTQKLSEQEEQMINVVTIIGTTSSLRTQLDVEELKKDAVSHSQLQTAFEHLTIVDGTLQSPAEVEGQYKPLRTWLGHVLRSGFSEHYLLWRDRLSDAAYWGRWDEVWDALKTGEEEYVESWPNASRLKPPAESDQMSLWTPLHQAVFNRAPIEVVQRLIDAGAFRTVRTRWTAYSFEDMTPLELARELGFSYLFDILAPVIHSPVPLHTLMILQDQFHDIIRNDLGDRVEDERMYLPVLEVLTELSNEVMWFPVKFTYAAAGYIYRLDERALIIKSVNIRGDGSSQTYQVTETETWEVVEALVSNG